MVRYALTLEYEGTRFMGFQRQAHGPTVQQAVEEAAESIVGHAVTLHSAGRTDAGVHARAMRAHFDSAKPLPPFRLGEALNARLRLAEHAVAVLDCVEVDPEWHARFTCIGRAYEYVIANRRAPLALEAGRAWRIAQPLDADAMHEAAQVLVGRHDFTTFRSAQCQSASPVKTLRHLAVRREGDHVLVTAEARSFLHHQVRSMVGCLAMVGERRWTAADLCEALEACDRRRLGHNAPPEGLYFMRALYPGE